MKIVIGVLVTCVFLLLLALCSGCSPAVQTKVQTDIADIVHPIQQTTLADAQAALVIAQANGDTPAVQCFTNIVAYLQNAGGPTLPVVNGVLSGLEAARTFKAPSIPANIHNSCAPLVLDAQQTALKLGLGGAVVTKP